MLLADAMLAFFELGSVAFGLLNIRAIRRDKVVHGIDWRQTVFYILWGFANLYIYAAASLPIAWWAGICITLVNIAWLCHVFYYRWEARHAQS